LRSTPRIGGGWRSPWGWVCFWASRRSGVFKCWPLPGLAHVFRLNKPVALLASNISIPPMMPFILYGGLALGHWLFTGRALDWSAPQATRARVLDYAGEWLVGSVVLATGVAVAGMAATYGLARLLTRKK
jgi:uncharacterized protein (DUF2062 family)